MSGSQTLISKVIYTHIHATSTIHMIDRIPRRASAMGHAHPSVSGFRRVAYQWGTVHLRAGSASPVSCTLAQSAFSVSGRYLA